MHISLSASLKEKSSSVLPVSSSISLYVQRQGFMQRPRLPLCPNTTPECMHCPDSAKHISPCTKYSTSMPVRSLSKATSVKLNSLLTTTRVIPKLLSNSTIWKLCVFIITDACIGILMPSLRTRLITAKSCTKIESG